MPGPRRRCWARSAFPPIAWVVFGFRIATAAEPFVPLAVMLNPVVATGTLSNFFVVGTMIGAFDLPADLFRGSGGPDGEPIRVWR